MAMPWPCHSRANPAGLQGGLWGAALAPQGMEVGRPGLDGCGVGVSHFFLYVHHPQIPLCILLPNTPLPSSITKGLHPSQCDHLLSIPQSSASSQGKVALGLLWLSPTLWAPALPWGGEGTGTAHPRAKGNPHLPPHRERGSPRSRGRGGQRGKRLTPLVSLGRRHRHPGSAGRSCFGCSCSQREGWKRN